MEASFESALLADYIKHSIKASTYLEKGDEDNYNRMCEEETKYLDLINSSEWHLVNNKGEMVKTLCPTFMKIMKSLGRLIWINSK